MVMVYITIWVIYHSNGTYHNIAIKNTQYSRAFTLKKWLTDTSQNIINNKWTGTSV